MFGTIKLQRDRTNIISIGLGMDVSQDTFTSEIRIDEDPESDLIAALDVVFDDDGTDGELVLTLDNSVAETIERTYGFMDLKRVSAGEPLSVFLKPIRVVFEGVVTA